MDKIEGEMCPFCHTKNLTLIEDEIDIPYFGKTFVFSMTCHNPECKYIKSDVEAAEMKTPVKITFNVESEDDLKVRVVKSSEATVKIPQMRMSVTPGPASNGYISNVEGLLDRFKGIIEGQRDSAEDPSVKKSAKNLLKKLWKVKCGEVPLKIVIEDPSGNSAIVSERAETSKLK